MHPPESSRESASDEKQQVHKLESISLNQDEESPEIEYLGEAIQIKAGETVYSLDINKAENRWEMTETYGDTVQKWAPMPAINPITFGRKTRKSGGHDKSLSRQHFEITISGKTVRIKSLSQFETVINYSIVDKSLALKKKLAFTDFVSKARKRLTQIFQAKTIDVDFYPNKFLEFGVELIEESEQGLSDSWQMSFAKVKHPNGEISVINKDQQGRLSWLAYSEKETREQLGPDQL